MAIITGPSWRGVGPWKIGTPRKKESSSQWWSSRNHRHAHRGNRGALISDYSAKRPRLLELLGHLVDPGLDAGLVLLAARCARRAGRADGIVTDLDRQRALIGDDVVEMDQAEARVGLQARDQVARGAAESARGVRLAHAVLHRVRPGVVAAHLHERLAVAADHGHRYVVAAGLAGGERGLCDRQGHGRGQVLALEQLRASRRRQRIGAEACERERTDTDSLL